MLTVLYAVSAGSVPVQMLLQIGAYMGVSENALKVTLSRLVKRGKIEMDEQGDYHIAQSSSLYSQHINQWRLGEKRRVIWNKSWIVCDLPKPAPAYSSRKTSYSALQVLGFQRNPNNGLFLRPNNLIGGISELRIKLSGIGLELGAELFVTRDYPAEIQTFFETQLWPVKELSEQYHELQTKLEMGHASLQKKITQAVLVNALLLGQEVSNMLASDPLLPEEMASPRPRVQLTRLMLEFEVLGKRLWEKTIPGLWLN